MFTVTFYMLTFWETVIVPHQVELELKKMSSRHTAVLEGITVFRRTEEGKRSRNHFPGTIGIGIV